MNRTVRRVAYGVVLLAALTGSSLVAQEAEQRDSGATIFVRRGCTECHGIWALGLKPRSDVAPDLTFAYVDVVNRYGMSLEAFLYNPRGVMRLMLASHLHLSAADRDSIRHMLERIYNQHRAQLNQDIPPIVKDTRSRN